jgi:hypothetical protein
LDEPFVYRCFAIVRLSFGDSALGQSSNGGLLPCQFGVRFRKAVHLFDRDFRMLVAPACIFLAASLTPLRVPFAISSDPAGTVIKPGFFYFIEDIGAVSRLFWLQEPSLYDFLDKSGRFSPRQSLSAAAARSLQPLASFPTLDDRIDHPLDGRLACLHCINGRGVLHGALLVQLRVSLSLLQLEPCLTSPKFCVGSTLPVSRASDRLPEASNQELYFVNM